MKYDPILCMMVDDTVKTKDAVPNGWKVTLEQNRNKHYVYSKAMTARGAELEAKKSYPDATVLNVERFDVSDKKTIDEAIRNCDTENPQNILQKKNKLLKEFNKEKENREKLFNQYRKTSEESDRLNIKYEDEVTKISKSGKSYREAESEVDKTPLGKSVKKAENDKNNASKNYYESLNKLKGMANELMELTESLPKEMRKYEWSLPRW